MICPKCKTENQYGNFCSNCGERLKEKCRECGKPERIGRKVCKTKIAQARERLSEYQRQNVGTWRISLILFGVVFWGLVMAVSFGYTYIAFVSVLPPLSLPVVGLITLTWKMMLLIDFFLLASLVWLLSNYTWQFDTLKRAKEEFFRLNSGDAELLKKASEE